MAYIELKNVYKSYGSGSAKTSVLENINLTAERGEFVAIVGYSGTGKTTLMSLIAGLTQPDSGTVTVDGKLVEGTSPDRGLVFQNYSLLPWYTVQDNVGVAVDQVFAEDDKESRLKRVLKSVSMVNLTDAIGKRPIELSGGMRQRTSVARTLSMKPKLLLLDEPLSALDALTRGVIQDQILDIWKSENQTIILITNDVDEALYMADRVIPLSIGPCASLGPEVAIPLERPRDKRQINTDAQCHKMRHEVISYLLAQKEKERQASTAKPVVLPNITPIDISMHRPSWFVGLRPNKKKEIQTAKY
jgi:nitrate/nitrite transport system ATP-binding protein